VIEKHDARARLMIGGDFNTSTIDRTRDRDQKFRRTQLAADPTRFLELEPYERLFRKWPTAVSTGARAMYLAS
jgi:hypothetical protein